MEFTLSFVNLYFIYFDLYIPTPIRVSYNHSFSCIGHFVKCCITNPIQRVNCSSLPANAFLKECDTISTIGMRPLSLSTSGFSGRLRLYLLSHRIVLSRQICHIGVCVGAKAEVPACFPYVAQSSLPVLCLYFAYTLTSFLGPDGL